MPEDEKQKPEPVRAEVPEPEGPDELESVSDYTKHVCPLSFNVTMKPKAGGKLLEAMGGEGAAIMPFQAMIEAAGCFGPTCMFWRNNDCMLAHGVAALLESAAMLNALVEVSPR